MLGDMTGRIRVGLLLDSLDVRAWVWTAIHEMITSSHVEIVAVGIVAGAGDAGAQADNGRGMPFRRALQRIDELLDRRIPADEDAFVRKNARPLIADKPVLQLERLGSSSPAVLAPEGVAALKALDLDTVLWFGNGDLRGDILHVARAGVWSIHQGDDRKRRGGPPGFWEVHEGWPVTGGSLEILGDNPEHGQTLGRTAIATVPTSIKRTRNALIWTALPLLGRALEQLHSEGVENFLQRTARENASPIFYSNPLFGSPGLTDLVVHGARRVARLVDNVARKRIGRQQWNLYYALGDDLVRACWRLRPLVPPIDRFWADPHVLEVGDRYFVFVEELIYATGKGHISVIEIDGEGHCSPSRKVLEEPHHLSYPFVFEHDGDIFMVPESSARGTVDLYRAASFPDRWDFVEHLMTGIDAVDATLLRERDRWWLFASVTKYRGAGSGELNLYSSDRLIGGNWRPHPANPLSSDVTRSRPAGAILGRGGRLYRPAQDGSGVYGRAIQLHEILELTETAYREELVTSIEPRWNHRVTRTHTLAHAGRLTVLDALVTTFRWGTASTAERGDERAEERSALTPV